MPSDLPPLPQGVQGASLVLAINDRLRRIALQLGGGAAPGPPGPAGPPGQPGLSLVPGHDTEVIYNHTGVFAASPNMTFAGDILTVLKGFVGLTFNSTATGAAHAVQQKDGTFVIFGSGDAEFQTVRATTTFNSLADIAASPATTAAFQTSGGDFIVYGSGDVQGQTFKATTTFSSLADVAASPATTAAFQTSGGDFIVFGSGDVQGQTFKATTTFSSLADVAASPATTAAFQTSGGDFIVFGSGDVQGQTFKATTTFSSLADVAASPATTAAFQTSGGDFIVYGSGDVQGQTFKATTTFNSLADVAASPATTAAFQTSGGNAIIYGNGYAQLQNLALTNPLAIAYGGLGITTAGTTSQVLIGGNPHTWGQVSLASMVSGSLPAGSITPPGSHTQIIFNNAGLLAASANFTYDPAAMILLVNGTGGIQARTFSSFATGATPAFLISGGAAIISGSGDAQFQNLALTNPLAIAYGGLGITTAGTTSQVLIGGSPHTWGQVNLGSMVSGSLPPGSITPPGSHTQVIFNNAGSLAADPNFTYDPAAMILLVNGTGGVQARTFSSFATGATAAFLISGGAAIITGAGDAQFQTVRATTTFNSLADVAASPATTAAFQTSGGNAIIYGNGYAQLQNLALTNPLAIAYGGLGITTAGTTSQVLIGGNPHTWGQVSLASMVTGHLPAGSITPPGTHTQVIFNNAGSLAADPNFTYEPAGMILLVNGTGGIQARTFSSFASGATPAFQQQSGTFSITGAGAAAFQTVRASQITATNAFFVSDRTSPSNQFSIYSDGNILRIALGFGAFAGDIIKVDAASGGVSVAKTLYALGALSISGFTSSAGDASFNGYIQTFTRFVCAGSNGVTFTLRDGNGFDHSVVGGIIVS